MKTAKIILILLPWLLLLLALLFWSLGVKLPGTGGDTKTEVISSTLILERMDNLGKLELVSYNFKEIFDYAAISDGRIAGETAIGTYNYAPDLKAVLIASGEAVGCIDLTKMNFENVVIINDTLYVDLPAPELCFHKLDLEQTRVYHFERTGWWSALFSDDNEVKSVIEKAYREAERQIKISALEGGILDKTNENAELLLQPMFEKISGLHVIIRTHDPIELITND